MDREAGIDTTNSGQSVRSEKNGTLRCKTAIAVGLGVPLSLVLADAASADPGFDFSQDWSTFSPDEQRTDFVTLDEPITPESTFSEFEDIRSLGPIGYGVVEETPSFENLSQVELPSSDWASGVSAKRIGWDIEPAQVAHREEATNLLSVDTSVETTNAVSKATSGHDNSAWDGTSADDIAGLTTSVFIDNRLAPSLISTTADRGGAVVEETLIVGSDDDMAVARRTFNPVTNRSTEYFKVRE